MTATTTMIDTPSGPIPTAIPIVYIGTQNDTNGNPRRGWILGYGTDNPRFCDEGYSGARALEAYGVSQHEGRYLPMIVVTPMTYRAWKKSA